METLQRPMKVLYSGLVQTTPEGLKNNLAPGSNPLPTCSVCPRHGAGDGLLHPPGCVFLRPIA